MDEQEEKVEDLLDLVAAMASIDEFCKTGELTDWDKFEKELDAMDGLHVLECSLISASSLQAELVSPEEDEAWKDLNTPTIEEKS